MCELTVNVKIVPRPLTGRGSTAPSQAGHDSTGGWTHRSHPGQKQMSNSPFAPPVQNARFAGVSSGITRGMSCSVVVCTARTLGRSGDPAAETGVETGVWKW